MVVVLYRYLVSALLENMNGPEKLSKHIQYDFHLPSISLTRLAMLLSFLCATVMLEVNGLRRVLLTDVYYWTACGYAIS